MNTEVNVDLLFQVIGEQQVSIRLMTAKIRELTEQLTTKEDKDETTEDN